jgi:hypothetical protein
MTTAVRCQVILPPNQDACGEPTTHKLTFTDGDLAYACESCALRLKQMMQSHGASVKVEKQ